MDNEFSLVRRALAKQVDSFINTLNNCIVDSDGLDREIIFVGEVSVADITHGKSKQETRVEPNQYNATLVVLKGSANINFDSGEKKSIDESNRCLYIPKQTGFTVLANSLHNSILTIVDEL